MLSETIEPFWRITVNAHFDIIARQRIRRIGGSFDFGDCFRFVSDFAIAVCHHSVIGHNTVKGRVVASNI